jgi:AraC-like DNA-binding protein
MAVHDAFPRGLKLHQLGDIELVAGRFRNHVLPRHSHDGLMLSLFSAGAQALRYRGVDHCADTGKIVAVPPDEAHSAEPAAEGGWCYATITIPSKVLEQHRPDGARFLCDTVISDETTRRLLQGLLGSMNTGAILQQEEALLDLLDDFFARHTRLPAKSPHSTAELRAVETCKAYLAAHLSRNVTLADLAVVARVDRFLLVRCFTRIVGISPHAWHLQRRLQHSLELLSKGQAVADAALATGFADQAHMTRAFKRLTGMTPGRFRKDHLVHPSSVLRTLL